MASGFSAFYQPSNRGLDETKYSGSKVLSKNQPQRPIGKENAGGAICWGDMRLINILSKSLLFNAAIKFNHKVITARPGGESSVAYLVIKINRWKNRLPLLLNCSWSKLYSISIIGLEVVVEVALRGHTISEITFRHSDLTQSLLWFCSQHSGNPISSPWWALYCFQPWSEQFTQAQNKPTQIGRTDLDVDLSQKRW